METTGREAAARAGPQQRAISQPQPCPVCWPPDPTASQFGPDFKGYEYFICQASPSSLSCTHAWSPSTSELPSGQSARHLLGPQLVPSHLPDAPGIQHPEPSPPKKKTGILDQLLPSKLCRQAGVKGPRPFSAVNHPPPSPPHALLVFFAGSKQWDRLRHPPQLSAGEEQERSPLHLSWMALGL